jgi:AcrR family transcriptional regulator
MSAETFTKRRRLSAEVRREQLMSAAVRVLSTRGYQGSTANEIAALAGLSKGLLWHYFDDLDDLFESTARRALKILSSAAGAAIDLEAPAPVVIRSAIHAAATRDTPYYICDDGRMNVVTVRSMTPEDYDQWQSAIADAYATEQVAAGNWTAAGAVERALELNAQLLPRGLETPRTLILRGIADDGHAIGWAWVGLDHPRGAPNTAYLYDFEIAELYRGRGFSRGLLSAVETEVREFGIDALELNVFRRNVAAVHLYKSTGYQVLTQQMRKQL